MIHNINKRVVSSLITIVTLVILVSGNEGSTEGTNSADLPLDVREYELNDDVENNYVQILKKEEKVCYPIDNKNEKAIGENNNNNNEGVNDGIKSYVNRDGEEEKKLKVPLREILMRMKPPSLMDDEEDEKDDLHLNFTKILEKSKKVPGTVENAGMSFNALDDLKNKTKSSNKKAICLPTETDDSIKLLNSTGLQALFSPSPNISTRATPSPCVLVFFFSHVCKFSVSAVPDINALHKKLEGIMHIYGVDSIAHHGINAQYGVMGTPSLLLFHGGHSVGHYNGTSYNGENFAEFFSHFTDYKLERDYNLTEEDYINSTLPVEVTPTSGIFLVVAWFFLLSCAFYSFVKSNFFDAIFEAVLNSWREAEAHQHQE